MSKSYQNTIDIFLPEKQLDKVIKSIITDSTPIELPKNPDNAVKKIRNGKREVSAVRVI